MYVSVLFFSRSLLLINSSRFIRASFHLSLALRSFSSAKSCLFCSFAPWSVSILNARLAQPNAVALNTELRILIRIVNNNAIYLLPKMVSNQSSSHNQTAMASFSSLCFSVSIFRLDCATMLPLLGHVEPQGSLSWAHLV